MWRRQLTDDPLLHTEYATIHTLLLIHSVGIRTRTRTKTPKQEKECLFWKTSEERLLSPDVLRLLKQEQETSPREFEAASKRRAVTRDRSIRDKNSWPNNG